MASTSPSPTAIGSIRRVLTVADFDAAATPPVFSTRRDPPWTS